MISDACRIIMRTVHVVIATLTQPQLLRLNAGKHSRLAQMDSVRAVPLKRQLTNINRLCPLERRRVRSNRKKL